MTAVGPWICDSCGEEISRAEDGYVIWKTSDQGATDFKIIHAGKCDDREYSSSMALDTYIGVGGLTHLMTFLSVGPVLLNGDLSGNSGRVASTDEFVDFVRRVQVPGYEQARRRYLDQDVREKLSDANEWYPYTDNVIQRIINDDL
jgi:hypothetical protein